MVLKIGPSRPGAVVEKRAKSADQLKLWVWQTGYYRFNVVDQRKYLKKLRDIHSTRSSIYSGSEASTLDQKEGNLKNFALYQQGD